MYKDSPGHQRKHTVRNLFHLVTLQTSGSFLEIKLNLTVEFLLQNRKAELRHIIKYQYQSYYKFCYLDDAVDVPNQIFWLSHLSFQQSYESWSEKFS